MSQQKEKPALAAAGAKRKARRTCVKTSKRPKPNEDAHLAALSAALDVSDGLPPLPAIPPYTAVCDEKVVAAAELRLKEKKKKKHDHLRHAFVSVGRSADAIIDAIKATEKNGYMCAFMQHNASAKASLSLVESIFNAFPGPRYFTAIWDRDDATEWHVQICDTHNGFQNSGYFCRPWFVREDRPLYRWFTNLGART